MSNPARPMGLRLTGKSDFDDAVERTPRGTMGPSFGPSTCGECQHWDRSNKRKRGFDGFVATCLKRLEWDRDVRKLKTKPEAVPAKTAACPYFERAGGRRPHDRRRPPEQPRLFGDLHAQKRPGAD